ncbi:MAG: sel1 repeat family protein [Deltaproteobacteria bacterium]|nr:sel1 repeat family protein [Deltaproteobacteria bacterium]
MRLSFRAALMGIFLFLAPLAWPQFAWPQVFSSQASAFEVSPSQFSESASANQNPINPRGLVPASSLANETISNPNPNPKPKSKPKSPPKPTHNLNHDLNLKPIKDERVRLNVIQALHIVIASVSDIMNSHDRVVVTNIMDNILRNLNQQEIDYNYEVIELCNSVIYSLDKFRLDNERLDLFQYAYDRKTLAAFALSATAKGPTYGWLDYLAPAFRATLSDFLDYGVNISAYRKSLGRATWELRSSDDYHLRRMLEAYLAKAWRLLEFYSTPSDPILTKTALTKFGAALNSHNAEKIIAQFQKLESELDFYPPYWFYLGYYQTTIGNLDEAAASFQRFERVWRPALRNDGLRADAAKYCLLEAIRQGDKEKQRKYAELIANNADKDAWLNLLLAGIVFDELGDRARAEDCFQHNLDNGRGLLASSLALENILHNDSAARALKEFVNKKPYFDDGTQEIVIIRENAGEGNPIAQYCLGFMYQTGVGAPKDLTEAAKWYRLAAERGYASAQSSLAALLLLGRGSDQTEAFNLYKVAADQGNVTAQTQLGLLYFAGVGVAQDKAAGVYWLLQAADQGDPEAQFALGGVYFRGNGAPMDKPAGLKWLRLAAEKGHIDAQFELGTLFERGDGTPLDKVEAAKWFGLAAAQGHHGAHERLSRLK